jgi:hypothetical protein
MTSLFRDSGRVNSWIIVSDLRDLEVNKKERTFLRKWTCFESREASMLTRPGFRGLIISKGKRKSTLDFKYRIENCDRPKTKAAPTVCVTRILKTFEYVYLIIFSSNEFSNLMLFHLTTPGGNARMP